MRKPAALSVLALSLATLPALADEGQWTPDQVASFSAETWKGLKARGLSLSPDEIWDGKGGGLLTASLNIGGCTASFVSPDGLIATNHHCAFGAIQLASTPEKNYLRDGFLAKTRADEVPARGGAGRALVIKRIGDVTAQVRGAGSAFAKAKSDRERYQAVERAKKEIVAACEKQPNTRCQVASFYDGTEYKLQEQTELRDIRLVYAPPRWVGEFGGEDDNFRFPRHTGDFSILRAYVSPDGKPADFAKENVPYRPAQFLKVSAEGVKPGDLVMILGYPGRTQRMLSSDRVKNLEEWFYPLRSKTYTDLIQLLENAAKDDPAVALKVSSGIKGYGNSETNARGQIEGLRRNGIAVRTRLEEEALAKVSSEAWRGAAAELSRLFEREKAMQERAFWLDEIERASGSLRSALHGVRWAEERPKADLERDAGYQQRDLPRAKDREKDFTKSFAAGPQRKVLAYLVAKALPTGVPSLAKAFGEKATAAEIEAKLSEMDGATSMEKQEVRLANLEAPLETLKGSTDPYVQLAVSLSADLTALRNERKEMSGALIRLRPVYLAGLKAFRKSKGKEIYPDANSTLRFSVAEVKGYVPREAVTLAPQTSVKGLLEKETGREPFASPERVLRAAREKNVGRFVDKGLGAVPICFLSNGDTTGGNSGSPTVNGRGELVGLNFDRVWENVAGDFGWSPVVSRNVNVDIRYALWLMGEMDGATELVKELLGEK